MPTVIAHHDVKDTEHWLGSTKREEFFGPLGVTNIRTFVDPAEPEARAVLMDVADMDAVMAAMQRRDAAAAMSTTVCFPRAWSSSSRRSPTSIFIAYTLPAKTASVLAKWARGSLGDASELRLVEAANLHVTLVFCGRVPPERVEEVVERTGAAIEARRAPVYTRCARAGAGALGGRARAGRRRARSRAAAAGPSERSRSS